MSGAAPESVEPAGSNATEGTPGSSSSASQSQPGRALRTLRIWPVVILLAILLGLKFALPYAGSLISSQSALMVLFMGPFVCAGLIPLWWLLLSRASWKERVGGFLALLAIMVGTTMLSDKSMIGAGTMLYALPWGMSAFAIALICLARRTSTSRTWLALLVALVCFGYWGLVRLDALSGSIQPTFSWRWEPTAEELFMSAAASREQAPAAGLPGEDSLSEPEWAAFRGPHRDGVQPAIVLAEDWQAEPLRELWRVRVGPGWSSFAVAGKRLFTQEQRDEDEVVVCYDATSGAQLWVHRNGARFWEALGGAGPRATPTLADGKLFALGATGLLNRLNPLTGELVWQRDISTDAAREPPMWGFSSSPLVVNGLVIVHAGGADDLGLLAYAVETGELRWSAPAGDHSYSSPQLSVVDGKECVLMLTNQGLTFVDPADGAVLGKHDWEYQGYRVVQPLVVAGSSIVLGTNVGAGTQRIEAHWDGTAFATEETWTSLQMTPDFNDFVAHEGFLYGFDKNVFACLDLATGERQWKRGRYGNGQVLLLPADDQLLVLSETGEAVLLRATPEKLTELARQQLLEGRTWNHPVLVGNRLFVRNSEEAACFEVPKAQNAAEADSQSVEE